MRMTGAEWTAFYNDPNIWKDSVYHDNLVIFVDDKNQDPDYVYKINPDANVFVYSGNIIDEKEDINAPKSIESVITEWKKNQSIAYENNNKNELFYSVCEQMKSLGYKAILN